MGFWGEVFILGFYTIIFWGFCVVVGFGRSFLVLAFDFFVVYIGVWCWWGVFVLCRFLRLGREGIWSFFTFGVFFVDILF